MQVKFVGPSGQVNYIFGTETGNSNPEPGKTYDVSDDLGQKLIEGSSQWEAVKGASPKESSRKTEVDN